MHVGEEWSDREVGHLRIHLAVLGEVLDGLHYELVKLCKLS